MKNKIFIFILYIAFIYIAGGFITLDSGWMARTMEARIVTVLLLVVGMSTAFWGNEYLKDQQRECSSKRYTDCADNGDEEDDNQSIKWRRNNCCPWCGSQDIENLGSQHQCHSCNKKFF